MDSFNKRKSHCGENMKSKPPQFPRSQKYSQGARYPLGMMALLSQLDFPTFLLFCFALSLGM